VGNTRNLITLEKQKLLSVKLRSENFVLCRPRRDVSNFNWI
jgi:hypothetical protein